MARVSQTASGLIPVKIDHRVCLACGACVGACPANAMALENSRPHIFEDICTHCLRCVQICPVRALSGGERS